MKKALIYIPVVLSLVLLGAHFLRYGNEAGVVGSLVLLALLIVRRPWVARLMQVVLILGTLEWLRTLYEMGQERATQGLPSFRMSVILGVVAAVTFASALLFQSPLLKRVYQLEKKKKRV